jgi:outer membrane protein OmpA-like peptidoglycan-associated protein
MRNQVIAALLLAGAAAGLCMQPASAASVDGYDAPYVAGFGEYELRDYHRQAKDGGGFQITAGIPLTPRASIELSYLDSGRQRNLDGAKDFTTTLFADYVYDFGLYGFKSHFIPNFKPYTIGGLGAVQEDSLGSKKLHPGADAGVGLLFPLSIGKWNWGWSIRTEARVLGQYNDKETKPANQTFLVDYHFQIGLEIPLTYFFKPHHSAPVVSGCSVAVVDPVTGRSDCVADSDRDGVPDSKDQCPDTPPGVKVNEVGCPNEGGDADGDGVLDADDLCPNTAIGVKVDAKGCAIEQVLVIEGVRFETNSAVLTGQATTVLDHVAASLNGQKNIKVEIDGHTDNVGSPAYNLLLSQQRAESVRQYLIGKGVDASRMTTQGFGETRPVASNKTAEGRDANRRVEFKIILK